MNKQNQSVASILASNPSQVSKSYLLAESHKFDGNTLSIAGLAPVTLSDNILKALFILKFNAEYKTSSNQQAILDSYANDYLNTLHEKSSIKDNPVANPAKVLTAEEYLHNCYKLALDSANLPPLALAMANADKLKDSSTKAELFAVVNQFKTIFLSEKQEESYKIVLKNELEDAIKFESLVDAGFHKIVRRGVNLQAAITMTDSQLGIAAIQKLGFNITDTKVSEDFSSLEVYFNEDAPAEL